MALTPWERHSSSAATQQIVERMTKCARAYRTSGCAIVRTAAGREHCCRPCRRCPRSHRHRVRVDDAPVDDVPEHELVVATRVARRHDTIELRSASSSTGAPLCPGCQRTPASLSYSRPDRVPNRRASSSCPCFNTLTVKAPLSLTSG